MLLEALLVVVGTHEDNLNLFLVNVNLVVEVFEHLQEVAARVAPPGTEEQKYESAVLAELIEVAIFGDKPSLLILIRKSALFLEEFVA